MSNSWTDLIVGDRMAVDQEFEPRVEQSEFSRQQWGLIMTAVEFEIENPDDAEAARIVPETSSLPHIMSELDDVDQQMNAMAGGAPGGSGGNDGGFLSGVLDAIGLGGGDDGVDADRLDAAEELTQAYADLLQAHLETQGKWESVREAAAD